LEDLVDRAQASITQCLEQGSSGETELPHEERLALSDAQHNLRALLRKIRLT
jgi:hypothetical protein